MKFLFTIHFQIFSITFYFCVLSVLSGTPFPCHYEFVKSISSYVVKQNKCPHVILCVLVVCNLKYTQRTKRIVKSTPSNFMKQRSQAPLHYTKSLKQVNLDFTNHLIKDDF